PSRPRAERGRNLLRVFEYESHLHVDLVAHDLAVVYLDALLLDPGALHVPERLRGPLDAHPDRILEALVGSRADLRHPRDGATHTTPDGHASPPRREYTVGAARSVPERTGLEVALSR